MNPKVVFAGVYILVLGGAIALVGALLGEPLTHEVEWWLVIGGFAFQAVGVVAAVYGTWADVLRRLKGV